jgi:ABC-type multidrug transport system ATPase subunit
MKIELRNINKSYGERRLLSDVSFSIESNRLTAISGEVGVGKSTLLRIIAGIESMDSGDILVNELAVSPTKTGYRACMGIVIPDFPFVEGFTVLDHLYFSIRFHSAGLDRREISKSHYLSKFYLNPYQKVGTLSSGQRMMLQILSAIMHKPKFLILDEPFSFLDDSTKSSVADMLLELKRCTTVLMVTHDTKMLRTLADVLFILDEEGIRLSNWHGASHETI